MAERNTIRNASRREHIFVLFLVLSFVNGCRGDGPVYVDPNNPSPSVIETSAPLVTQTVYGFLDFTTTIGNTLMIFSPQSQPSPDSTKNEIVPTPTPTSSAPVATTVLLSVVNTDEGNKPTTLSTQQTPTSATTVTKQESNATPSIKPTKTITPSKSSDKKPIEELKEKTTLTKKSTPSSIVNVESGNNDQSKTTKATVILSSIVEVKGGTQSIKSTPSVVVLSRVDEKPPQTSSAKIISSVVEKVVNKPTIISSVVNVAVNNNDKPKQSKAQIISSKVEVLSSSEEPAISGNNLEPEAEYDFLSRQPSEVVDETYKVIDLRSPNSKIHHHGHHNHKNRATNKPESLHPTGLVTSMGGTIVKDGLTTVHETNVIGTYISGKYAQVLQSTSHVYPQQSNKKIKPTPSSQTRILKTSAPNLKSNQKVNLEPTPASSTLQEDSALPLEALFNSPSGNLIRQSRRPAISAGSPFKNRFNRNRVSKEESSAQDLAELEEQIEQIEDNTPATPQPSYKKNRPRDRDSKERNNDSKSQQSSNGRSSFNEPSSSASPASSRRHQTSAPSNSKDSKERRGGFKPSTNNNNVDSNQSSNTRENRRNFKPSKPVNDHGSTSLYKFKLSRPSGRWQYKTTPKPRVPIRRQDNDFDVTSQAPQGNTAQVNNYNDEEVVQNNGESEQLQQSAVYNNQESPASTETTIPIETIKVEISTPADFKDTYYEIATVKSPYTFQVGTVKNTRFITVTSTIEKSLVEPTEAPALHSTEPLTENILASTANAYDKEPPLDSSIATLPPITLAADAETPPLETMTETFSTTQLLLKTHILPVIRGADNTSYTLVQSYHVTRVVTATKTLPPMEVYQFVPSKTLNEFNTRLDEAGSELHLELEFGDNNDPNDDEHPTAARAFPPDLDLANVGSEFNLSDMDKTKFLTEQHLRLKKAHHHLTTTESSPTTPALSAEQLQQLALLRFLNPNAIPPVITSSKPVIKLETVYESHVIPLFNGQSTLFSTISRPIATISKTEYELVTSALPTLAPPINPLFQQQQPQIPQQPQLPQIPQQQFALTSTPVVTQTIVTETNSKVLKLTFGAKTAYTTLYSTKVVPTMLTTFLTASVPVQPTVAAFPGYFPAPYNPYNPFAG